MRMRTLLGGLAIVAVVTVWHWPAAEPVGGAATDYTSAPGTFCTAVAGLSRALRDPLLPFNAHDVLPPRGITGAVDPAITQGSIDTTICRPGYAAAARPPIAITAPLKRRMMVVQHPGERLADYELDHLIPISLGGAPLEPRNLWLQPRGGQANAGDKNVLAYVLWRLVCTDQMPLVTAQAAIRQDWTKAYQTYATPENIARFHFRHDGEDTL